ncbi:MAG: ATP phosphoribosyltransferase regulatory subunit, partial [Patescibacteria group bacterium]|nr:ATP phosphoribosyltransferase regulatory subunit [Patescibacteria group bacterium]
MPKKVLSLAGLPDIICQSDDLWAVALKRLSRLSRTYGFEHVETPLLEDFRLYEAFYKTSEKSLLEVVSLNLPEKAAVRANLLPSVLRAYYQSKIYDKVPLSKWQFAGNVVKQTKSEGLVNDYQFGFEVFGVFNHLTEAQVIGGVWEFLQGLGLKDAVLEINHIGQNACQVAYEQTLRDFLLGKKYQLCDDCNEHLAGRVLNVLRCQNLDCQTSVAEAPAVLDFLEEDSKQHFTNILEALDEMSVPYQLNPL